MVEDAVSSGRVIGIKLARNCPTLSHLLFADDSLFFFRATQENRMEIKGILDMYCQAEEGLCADLSPKGFVTQVECDSGLRRDVFGTCLGPGHRQIRRLPLKD